MKRRSIKRALSVLTSLGICITLFAFGGTASAEEIDPMDKIDPILLKKMENAGDTERFDVMLWLTDIDDSGVEQQAQARTQSKMRLYSMKTAAASLNGEQAEAMAAVDETQTYIEEKRAVYAEKYADANQKKFDDIFPATRWNLFSRVEQEQPTVVYSCVYAPTIKAKMNKAQILTAAQSSRVDMVYDDVVHFENADLPEDSIQPMNSSTISSASVWQGATNAALVRDTNGLSGSGVKIGQIELAAVNLNVSGFSSYVSTFRLQWLAGTLVCDPKASNNTASANSIKHAAQVASIMIGEETNGVKGIARSAELYTTTIDRTDGSNYQGGYEWLLSQGVNIINMSASIEGMTSTYSLTARWLDHIAMHHDVTLVLASGKLGGNTVANSSMAYNAITVGALDDRATSSRSDDEHATSYSSYVDGSIVSKPDICAPGDNLQLAIPGSSYGERSGTSFAAPQVTAIIAQMLQMRPEIKTKQAVIKAIVLSGVSSWKGLKNTPANTNTRAMDPKTGAGEVDSKAMRYIAQAQRYVGTTLTSGVNTYTKTFNVPAGDTLTRVALTWLRNIHMPSSNHNQDAQYTTNAKLKLEVTAPGGQKYTSYVAKENCQLVSFAPPQSGTYTIKVTVMERPPEGYIYIGLAFY